MALFGVNFYDSDNRFPPVPVIRTIELKGYQRRNHGGAGCWSVAAYVPHLKPSERPTVKITEWSSLSLVIEQQVYLLCNRKIATRLTLPFRSRCHRQNCRRGESTNIEMNCSELFFPHKHLSDCPPFPFCSTSLKEELKDLKETTLFEEERVKAVLQGLRR